MILDNTYDLVYRPIEWKCDRGRSGSTSAEINKLVKKVYGWAAENCKANCNVSLTYVDTI